MSKFCRKCGTIRPAIEFHKDSSSRDGLQAKCKVCKKIERSALRESYREKVKITAAAWYAANAEKSIASATKWREANTERAKANNAKWHMNNLEIVKARKADWFVVNREKVRAQSAKWRAANPEALRGYCQNRRALKRANGGKLSKGLSSKLFRLQRGKCPCCGHALGDNYHMDHIMPLALGGSNTDDNIQLLRQRCNQQKRAAHPIDFMQLRGFLL
jgi:hypothetical protein